MATVAAVRNRTQSKTAMSKVMRYVSQDKKTLLEQEQKRMRLLSGKDCLAETAFQEFMATKRQYEKEKGRYFYQYIQSFPPGENATPQEIHQMGLELAEYFKGYEVLVATHIDRDHWHNHLIVNSVSHETGLKLQFNEQDLHRFRDLSDTICQSHGLEVLARYQKQGKKSLEQREYRAALRGDSFKFKLMAAIDHAMAQSRSKGQFTACMEKLGYQMKWEPQHKYITYTTPEGKKCRDNRLHESKYLKSEMEEYFEQFNRAAQTAQHTRRDYAHAVPTADLRYSGGTMGGHAEAYVPNGGRIAGNQKIHERPADNREGQGYVPEIRRYGIQRPDPRPAREHFQSGARARKIAENGASGNGRYNQPQSKATADRAGAIPQAQGYVPRENHSEMGGDWRDNPDNLLLLAKTVGDMVNALQDQQEEIVPAPPISEEEYEQELSQDFEMEM